MKKILHLHSYECTITELTRSMKLAAEREEYKCAADMIRIKGGNANGERMKCWRVRSCKSITRYQANNEPQPYANRLNANILYAVLYAFINL